MSQDQYSTILIAILTYVYRGSELNWQNNYIPAPGTNTSVYYDFGKGFAVNMAYEVDPDPAAWWPEYFDFDTPFSEFAYME